MSPDAVAAMVWKSDEDTCGGGGAAKETREKKRERISIYCKFKGRVVRVGQKPAKGGEAPGARTPLLHSLPLKRGQRFETAEPKPTRWPEQLQNGGGYNSAVQHSLVKERTPGGQATAPAASMRDEHVTHVYRPGSVGARRVRSAVLATLEV